MARRIGAGTRRADQRSVLLRVQKPKSAERQPDVLKAFTPPRWREFYPVYDEDGLIVVGARPAASVGRSRRCSGDDEDGAPATGGLDVPLTKRAAVRREDRRRHSLSCGVRTRTRSGENTSPIQARPSGEGGTRANERFDELSRKRCALPRSGGYEQRSARSSDRCGGLERQRSRRAAPGDRTTNRVSRRIRHLELERARSGGCLVERAKEVRRARAAYAQGYVNHFSRRAAPGIE